MSPPLRGRGSLACLLTVALAATACGGSSKSGAAKATGNLAAATTTPAAAPTTGAAMTSAATASSGGVTASAGTSSAAPSAASSSTSAASVPSLPVAVTTTKVKATGGGEFCKDIADAVNNPITPTGGTSLADEKALITKTLAQGELALSKAPAAIRPDAVIVLGAVDNLFKALQKANYDYTKIDPAALAAVSSPAVTTAEAHLTAYVKTTCGIALTTG